VLFRKFHRNARGSVLPMFALAIIPLVGFVGAAIDYSRAANSRTEMQAALDATSLWISKNAATQTAAQIQTAAVSYFNAQFTNPETKILTITSIYSTSGGSSLTVAATGSLSTRFMGIIGVSSMNIGSSSTVRWGTSRLRVALVLDTTGSMSDFNKIGSLKTATKNLLTQLKNAATTNGDVYVSIIPFSKNVNVGALNSSANWIDWTAWESEPSLLQTAKPSNWDQVGPGDACPFTNSSHGFRCDTGPTTTTNTSSVPSSGTYSGYICPGTDTGQKDSPKIGIMYNGCYNSVQQTRTISTGSSASCGSQSDCSCSGSGSNRKCTQSYFTHNWIKNARSTWNGCVTERGTLTPPGTAAGNDQKSTQPSTGDATTLFPAEQNAYCSSEAIGLNYNWSTMTNLVDNLSPLGATNQPIGLVWGWQTLVGGGPFTVPTKDSNYQYQDIIILMSDGLNTLDRWYGNGSSTNTSVDSRMYDSTGKGTCANVKAAGITIYAVHVNTDSDPTSVLLKNCASGADKFWMITTPSQLDVVFNAIGTNLTKLRISK
jgi:Flp pilus assembly protein TadG